MTPRRSRSAIDSGLIRFTQILTRPWRTHGAGAASRAVRRCAVAATLAVSALANAFATPVVAQTVRGTVVTEGSGEPVPGALTILLDTDGGRVAAGLSGPHGEFELTAPGPGSYRVSAERIGYTTSYTPFFDLSANAVVVRTVVASVEPVSLGSIHVTARSRCRPQKNAPVDVQKLWDEARKTLTAVSLVEDAPRVTFQLERWEVDLDPATNKVEAATRRQAEAAGDYPFRSPPADVLLEHGFVQAMGDSSIFYAPDAHALLSDAFQAAYCFRVVAGDSGLVGLAFEPMPRTGHALGVDGTLWLDSATAELKKLKYSYRGMDYRIPSAVPGGLEQERRPGGEMDFRRLSNGSWIVSNWSIRAPRYVMNGGTPTGEVAFVHESDGRVLSVSGVNDTFLADRPGVVRGRLLTDGGVPLPGVLVYLSGTPYADTTDTEGAFAMTGLRPGEYELAWYDGERDATAEHVKPRTVQVGRGHSQVEIRVAGMDSLLNGGCSPGDRREASGVVVGVVREKGTGVPLGGVRVRAVGPAGRREATSDEGGRFHFCWLPVGSYALEAEMGGFGSTRANASVEDGRITHPDLELAVAAVAAPGHHTPPPRLTGRVVDAATGKALAGVTIRLDGTKQSRVSDEAGRFAFEEAPAGEVRLQATRPGYADASGSVSTVPGQSVRVEVRMATRPYELEPIVVTAVQTRRLGVLADVQYRMKHEHGTFILHREIEARNPRYISRLIPITISTHWQARGCGPAYYVDGIPVHGVDFLTPTSVEAVEIYEGPADVPAEYSGSTAGCGVVAVWTSRGVPLSPDTTGSDQPSP